MSKFIFTTFDRYDVTNSTTVIIESKKESLVEILEDLIDGIWGTEMFAEEYKELVKEGENCCGIDLEEESYLLTKIS